MYYPLRKQIVHFLEFDNDGNSIRKCYGGSLHSRIIEDDGMEVTHGPGDIIVLLRVGHFATP